MFLKKWMNDPNGCFKDVEGTWHLYYQFNPVGLIAANQSWGHSTSKDLYHWKNEPVALFPLNDSSLVFTGSTVIDRNNTSGFFPEQTNGVVAIFTIDTSDPVSLQTQALAYSKDNGYNFAMYEGNPVLDIGSSQFRDPKVYWYRDHWVMLVAYAQELTLGFYTSPNLKNWTHASNFSHYGLLGLQYECPNLIEIPIEGMSATMWELLISVNPGAPLGGSVMQYILGDFDGYSFKPSNDATHLTDFAQDSYAGQSFSNVGPGEAMSINWASNWAYAQMTPEGPLEGWRSANSLPRRHVIKRRQRLGYVDARTPYNLEPVIGEQIVRKKINNDSMTVDFSDVYSNAIYLKINFTGLPSTEDISAGTMNYTFSSPQSGEMLSSGFYLYNSNYFWINRGSVKGFDNVFVSPKFATNSIIEGSSWSMEAVFDRSIYEVFLDGGAQSGTVTFFPQSPLTELHLATSELPAADVSVEVELYALNSVWM